MTVSASSYDFNRPNMGPVLSYMTGVEIPSGWDKIACALSSQGYVKIHKPSRVYWLGGNPAEAWEAFQARDWAPEGDCLWLGEGLGATPYPPTPAEVTMWGACGPALIASALALAMESERSALVGRYQLFCRTVREPYVDASVPLRTQRPVTRELARNSAHAALLSLGMSCSVTRRVPGHPVGIVLTCPLNHTIKGPPS